MPAFTRFVEAEKAGEEAVAGGVVIVCNPEGAEGGC